MAPVAATVQKRKGRRLASRPDSQAPSAVVKSVAPRTKPICDGASPRSASTAWA